MGHLGSRRLNNRSWNGSVGLATVVVLGCTACAGVISTPSAQQGTLAVDSVAQLSPTNANRFSVYSFDGHQTSLVDSYFPSDSAGTHSDWLGSARAGDVVNVSGLDDILDPSPVLSPAPSSSPLQITTTGGDAATAIPLPPAVQSGITGIAALAMAGLFRSIRRALR